jgi:putative transposase
MCKSYRTDLTDGQWELLRKLIPAAKSGGRPRTVDKLKRILNAF